MNTYLWNNVEKYVENVENSVERMFIIKSLLDIFVEVHSIRI